MANQYGNWINDGPLSEGGQAHIYLVHRKDDENEKKFALKRLKNTQNLERFRDEIKAVSKLDHPNILKLVDYDLDSKKPYLVTEYCSGGSLNDLDLSSWTFLDKLELFRSICEGVAYAHNHRIVHRDLKPGNIFFREDRRTPVVGDFGICFINDSGKRVTLTDEAVGSTNYIAPELEDGRTNLVSNSADVYSLGKILYWIIEGKIFSREKHRNHKWDLANKNQDLADFKIVRRAFVNELLDWSIISSPKRRFRNAGHLKAHVKIMIRRLKNGAHPIDQEVYQICDYCGKGHYKIYKDSENRNSNEIERFGIRHLDQAKWMVLHCSNCGHIQQFRTDLLEENPWKERVRPW